MVVVICIPSWEDPRIPRSEPAINLPPNVETEEGLQSHTTFLLLLLLSLLVVMVARGNGIGLDETVRNHPEVGANCDGSREEISLLV